jgi:chromosome segregation ATPase
MNKKKILALTLSMMLVLPTTAFAKGNDKANENGKPAQQEVQNKKTEEKAKTPTTKAAVAAEENKNKGEDKKQEAQENKSKGEEKKQEAQQNKDAKKEQIAQFKTAMKAKHDQMKQLREQTVALKKQVEQKKEQLSSIIADLESGKKTLSDDMLNSLLALSQNLLTDTEKVKETAEIKTDVENTEAKVKGADFNNALASMDKVIAKMQARLDALTKLNADLDAALKIANLAVVPAPTTGTTTDGSTQTTTPGTSTTTTDGTTAPAATTTDSTTTPATTTTNTTN